MGRGVGCRRSGLPEPRRRHGAMTHACPDGSDDRGAIHQNAAPSRTSNKLALAAAPTFAFMARKLCDGAQTTRLTVASVFASQTQEPTVPASVCRLCAGGKTPRSCKIQAPGFVSQNVRLGITSGAV